MKLIDQLLESEKQTQKRIKDRQNALTLETASNPVVIRLLQNASLMNLKPWRQQQHHHHQQQQELKNVNR